MITKAAIYNMTHKRPACLPRLVAGSKTPAAQRDGAAFLNRRLTKSLKRLRLPQQSETEQRRDTSYWLCQ